MLQNWTNCSTNNHRIDLLKEALKPPKQTADWKNANIDKQALDDISFHTFSGLEEEAIGISLMLKECLEEKGKTAVCITPDRNLARRIVSSMKRFGVDINDSGGTPLKSLPSAVFLRLLAKATSFEPVPLLALLKHPFCLCGMERKEVLKLTRKLEKTILRGIRPDIDKIKKEFEFLYKEIKLFADLLSPPLVIPAKAGIQKNNFHILFKEHIKCAENISSKLWDKDEGEAAANFIRELLEIDIGEIEPSQYLPIFEQLLEGQIFRPKFGLHPRINILGTIEANLQSADLVIVSGLNEGIFPSHSSSGIWLSRPMREEIGLPSPDEKTGLSAHDFYMAVASNEVILTRSEKVDGTPTIPSRWWLRLQAVVKSQKLELPTGKPWSSWAKLINKPEKVEPAKHTEANPPLYARPKELHVTQVETLMKDPYSIYAKKILGLKALNEIDEELSMADFGNAVHKALEEYVKNKGDKTLLECGKEFFGDMLKKPIVRAFWWSRFERIAEWFIENHNSRNFDEVFTEEELDFVIPAKAGIQSDDFKFTGKADRIEKIGQEAIIADYKTGVIPSKKDIFSGYSPQLLLLAVLAQKNGYIPIGLEYWKLSGKDDNIDNILNYKEIKDIALSDILEETEEELTKLIKMFFFSKTPFIACPNEEKLPSYNDYEHLERLKEK